MSLRDPVRSFWISRLDYLRIFGSLVRRIFFSTLFFSFNLSILFLGIFKQGSSFFSIGLFLFLFF